MKTQKPIVIDFETAGIEGRPKYPPAPAGVAIKKPGEKKGRYFAFGHPTKNNATKEQAFNALSEAYDSKAPLLFHNAKFDLDVAAVHFGLEMPSWERVQDTLFLLFLQDPHSRSLSLKPASERLLDMPPEERDAVKDWLVDHDVVRSNQKDWGAHIAKAPGDVVGPYAIGDVVRTEKLYEHLLPLINEAGMGPAYDRERRLMPILLENERVGVRVDVPLLEHDVAMYERALERVDAWVRKRLKAPGLNLDSNEELADALEASGVVTEFVMTKTGKRSVAKKNLTLDMYQDAKVAAAVGYRNALTTCMTMFMRPWLAQARVTGGVIYTTWNQVRQAHGDDNMGGARTGRMSSTPPLLNIPKEFPDEIAVLKFLKDLPPLPFVRRYLIPDDKKSVWLRRDYNQQEYRILGHYEDGSLQAAYLENPRTDIHDWLQKMLAELLMLILARKDVKTVNFADLYGMGLGIMAERLKTDVNTVKRIKAAKRKLMTGLAPLEKQIKAMGRGGQPITTWGGRRYYAETPRWNGSRMQTYEYKLLNYLIQGSAADCTKEAIIRYHEARKHGRFLVAVHDEINLSVPKKALKEESTILRDVMKSVEFDVPMLSDGEYGPNWFDLTDMVGEAD